jgi:hypothetical protein
MNVHILTRAYSDTVGGAAGQAAGAPYALAFLSSTAIEVVAVATVLTMLAFGLARSLFRSSGAGHRPGRAHRALYIMKLHKMLIPLACLSATVWVWSLIQGA